MKSGEIIKQRLGLSHLKYVMISRVLGTSYKTYVIFYDSRRPTFPITNQRALKGPPTGGLFLYPFEDEPTYLPLMKLEDFNGALHPSMFFVVDMSGDFGRRENKVNLQRESIEERKLYPHFFGSLKEFITFSDLKGADTLGNVTRRTRRTRNSELGTENRLAKLVDVNIDTVEDHVTFVFKTQATTPIYPDDAAFQKTNPDNFQLQRNPDKEYELYLRVLNFFEWLRGTKPDTQEITRQDVKDVIQVNNVQVFSTSPSFHWQGMNANLSQLDGSIYPTDIMPTVWKDRQGSDDYLLDKHLYGLVRQINFFDNQMASMLTKRLRDRDLI